MVGVKSGLTHINEWHRNVLVVVASAGDNQLRAAAIGWERGGNENGRWIESEVSIKAKTEHSKGYYCSDGESG